MKKSILIACALCISIASYAQSKAPSKYTTKQAQKYTNEIIEYVSNVMAEKQKLVEQIEKINIFQIPIKFYTTDIDKMSGLGLNKFIDVIEKD